MKLWNKVKSIYKKLDLVDLLLVLLLSLSLYFSISSYYYNNLYHKLVSKMEANSSKTYNKLKEIETMLKEHNVICTRGF